MPKPAKTSDVLDIAARYLVYKLYATMIEQQVQWHALQETGEKTATIARAVELGWVVLREGNRKKPSGTLTEEGRRLGRLARYAIR